MPKHTFAELTAALLLVGGKWDLKQDNSKVWVFVDHDERLKDAIVSTFQAYGVEPDLRPEVLSTEVTYTSCRIDELRAQFPDCDLWG